MEDESALKSPGRHFVVHAPRHLSTLYRSVHPHLNELQRLFSPTARPSKSAAMQPLCKLVPRLLQGSSQSAAGGWG